jgi:uncharacterized alkaline shock family protein YloU
MSDAIPAGAPESVHSEAVSAHISHAVIATYAAAAALEVEGVEGLAGGGFRGSEHHADPERASRGVRVVADGDGVGLELHLVTGWGASIPALAEQVERQVRAYLASMIDLDVARVTILVDDVARAAR